jgi:transcriptional regulator with XRE-family HTH domain
VTTLGERVKELRENKGWSQEQLAENVSRRGYKIGQSAIGNIEAERVKNPKCIVQLAAALDISPVWLQTGKGQKEATEHRPPTRQVFISHATNDQDKVDFLMNKIYDADKMPMGSPEEKAVVVLFRHLKKQQQ